MNLKEKLIKVKQKLLEKKPISGDFEFDAELEEHPIGNQDTYRLYYINYHNIGENYGYGSKGIIDWPCKPFKIPQGMSREEGFKVLSYLTDFIEKSGEIEECSLKSVIALDNVLDIEELGFTHVDEKNEDEIINLFTIDGRILRFKESKLYEKYFEWYIKDVSFEEVKEIYTKHNIKLIDNFTMDEQKLNVRVRK